MSAEQIILVSPPMNHKAGVTRRAEGPSANATLVKTDAYALSCMDISRQMMTRRLDLYHAMESTVLVSSLLWRCIVKSWMTCDTDL